MEQRYHNEFLWNGILSLVFLGIIGISLLTFGREIQTLVTTTETFQFFVFSLASFRLIRLISYDRIFAFVREFFNRKREGSGFMLSIYHLMLCPWCIGIWVVLGLLLVYLIAPLLAEFLILLLAIAGVATALQIGMNLIGWSAERQKKRCEKE